MQKVVGSSPIIRFCSSPSHLSLAADGHFELGVAPMIRALMIGVAIALIVFLLSAGHIIFLPLLFVPLGLFGFGHRRRHRRYW
jgi:hypothetical protein